MITKERKNSLLSRVDTGDGAVMTIIDPRPFKDGGLEWINRYGHKDDLEEIRYINAGVISSYDYLLSAEITETEAIRRLKMMRSKRSEICKL